MVVYASSLRSAVRLIGKSRLLACQPKTFAHASSAFSTQEDPDQWVIHSKFAKVDVPDRTITQHIFDAQEKHAGKTAIISGETGESLTHAEVRRNSERLGSALCRLGATKGDVVALILPNSPQFCISFLGISCAGAIPTTINSHFTSYEIARQLDNSGACMVICGDETLKTVQEACKTYGGIREIIIVGQPSQGTRSYDTLLKDDGKGIPNYTHTNNSEDIAVLPYSSGTTGLPKGVMLTHRNLVANLEQATHPSVSYFKHHSADYQDTLMLILPMYHIYGMACGVFGSLYHGSRSITLRTFDQDLYAKLYQKYQATIAYTVPPLMSFMCSSDLVDRSTLRNTHTVICAAAPVGPSLLRKFQKKFGTEIVIAEGFGMTELSPVSHSTPTSGKIVFGSCGQAVPNTQTKIVDINTGLSIAPEQGQGEIWVKGPQVMKGYLNNAKATAETITPEGWLRTGDIGRIDKHGNLFIVDRLKELIKVKGLQVPPAELEDLLRSHPEVQDVAVIGIPDERSGELPKAFVVAKPGGNLTEHDVIAFVAERVADYKRLAGGVTFIDAIPKNPSGKILRKDLRLL